MGKRLVIPGADFSANAIEQEPIYTLVNGYATAQKATNIEIDRNSDVIPIRVRTNELFGAYIVKTKPGYVLRGIALYDNHIASLSPGIHTNAGGLQVTSVQGTTEYTQNNANKYSIITFCKTDATQEISASEDIVDYIIRPSE